MKSIKYLIIVILLSGCAGQTLHRQGATEADAMKDNMECELQGAQYASGMGFNGNLLIIGDYKTKCLRGRGWM